MASGVKGHFEPGEAKSADSSPRMSHYQGESRETGEPAPRRMRWHLQGQVQGVGLRPHIYRLARQLGLNGLVRNDDRGVVIEAQGESGALATLNQRLRDQPPPLCRIDRMTSEQVPLQPDDDEFVIAGSDGSQLDQAAGVTIDAAVCDDCLRELFDPADRRYHYPLINCTHCGPRYTIVRATPYDRPNTTMAHFALCDACAAEYADPDDRRFHAQPVACPNCGPQVQLVDPHGCQLDGEPIATAAAMLGNRAIVAVKGLGGFHLACRADEPSVVTRLRQLKNRDAKPFALMVRDLPTVERLVQLSDIAIEMMRSPACPIILAPRQSLPGMRIAAEVAPGMHRLGVMLPYTPLHHLLFASPQCPDVLVMTSGNVTDEPLVRDNDEAITRLAPLCDAMLWHNRPIQRSVDDSVFIDFASTCSAAIADHQPLLPVRRARGYVPAPIDLPTDSSRSPGLCLGGELKNTIAVVRDGQAILSHHLGDLKHPAALANFKQAIDDLCNLTRVTPRWIAHDMHPAYLSTLHAQKLARQLSVPLLAVQHHHAHAAAVLAEHHHHGPAMAIVCDGVGYGSDGAIWGGELMLAGFNDFVRLAHLRPLPLPGGDAAAIDARRGAMALLRQAMGDEFAYSDDATALYTDFDQRHTIATMLRHNVRTVASTAAGRYFDAVAALLGLATVNQFEAQAAMALEAAAYHAPPGTLTDEPLFTIESTERCRQIDLSPLIGRIIELHRAGHDRSALAALFHEQLAQAFAVSADQAAQRTGVRVVALSGGCFCNQLFTHHLTEQLLLRRFTVLRHHLVPPGDGGIALGQAAIAAERLSSTPDEGGLR